MENLDEIIAAAVPRQPPEDLHDPKAARAESARRHAEAVASCKAARLQHLQDMAKQATYDFEQRFTWEDKKAIIARSVSTHVVRSLETIDEPQWTTASTKQTKQMKHVQRDKKQTGRYKQRKAAVRAQRGWVRDVHLR